MLCVKTKTYFNSFICNICLLLSNLICPEIELYINPHVNTISQMKSS